MMYLQTYHLLINENHWLGTMNHIGIHRRYIRTFLYMLKLPRHPQILPIYLLILLQLLLVLDYGEDLLKHVSFIGKNRYTNMIHSLKLMTKCIIPSSTLCQKIQSMESLISVLLRISQHNSEHNWAPILPMNNIVFWYYLLHKLIISSMKPKQTHMVPDAVYTLVN